MIMTARFESPAARPATGGGSICGGYSAGGGEAIVGCVGFEVGKTTVGSSRNSPK